MLGPSSQRTGVVVRPHTSTKTGRLGKLMAAVGSEAEESMPARGSLPLRRQGPHRRRTSKRETRHRLWETPSAEVDRRAPDPGSISLGLAQGSTDPARRAVAMLKTEAKGRGKDPGPKAPMIELEARGGSGRSWGRMRLTCGAVAMQCAERQI